MKQQLHSPATESEIELANLTLVQSENFCTGSEGS